VKSAASLDTVCWLRQVKGIINKREEVNAMTLLIEANPVPLQADPDGTIRVAGTRLTLDTVLRAYQGGATPEQIVERFSGLSLPDAYAVIGYYLRYRQEVDVYLRSREQAAAALRQEIEAGNAPGPSRDELLARRARK
jgi:uncharacterized protein (DUF433 family)